MGKLTVLASDRQSQEQDIDGLLIDWAGPKERLSWLDGGQMAALFSSARLAIVPSSVLAFEALTMGAAVISRECVANQRHHAETLRRLGAVSVQEVDEIITLARSGAGGSIPPGTLDNRGAQRVAEVLMGERE